MPHQQALTKTSKSKIVHMYHEIEYKGPGKIRQELMEMLSKLEFVSFNLLIFPREEEMFLLLSWKIYLICLTVRCCYSTNSNLTSKVLPV